MGMVPSTLFLRKEVVVWFRAGRGNVVMAYRPVPSHFQTCSDIKLTCKKWTGCHEIHAPLPPIDTIWAMMIVWKTREDYRTARAVLEAIITFSAMHTYYEQLLQVKQICLCLTGFTSLCLDVYVFCVLLYFTACMLYYCNMVGWAWWDWGLIWWLTILLQCFDTVGWFTWPVKISSPNDLYCVEWDVKPYSTQLTKFTAWQNITCRVKYQSH